MKFSIRTEICAKTFAKLLSKKLEIVISLLTSVWHDHSMLMLATSDGCVIGVCVCVWDKTRGTERQRKGKREWDSAWRTKISGQCNWVRVGKFGCFQWHLVCKISSRCSVNVCWLYEMGIVYLSQFQLVVSWHCFIGNAIVRVYEAQRDQIYFMFEFFFLFFFFCLTSLWLCHGHVVIRMNIFTFLMHVRRAIDAICK